MVFRKNALLCLQNQIFSGVMALVSLCCVPMLGWMFLWAGLLFVALLLLCPRLYDEMITVDEAGIACRRGERLLWAYEWNEIAALRKSTRYALPAVEIIAYDRRGAAEHYALFGHYFQLGKAAKAAMERYSPFNEYALFGQ